MGVAVDARSQDLPQPFRNPVQRNSEHNGRSGQRAKSSRPAITLI